MTMKRRMILAALVLGLVAALAWLFVDSAPRVPMTVGIVGMTNLPAGGVRFTACVTNQTSVGFALLIGAHAACPPGLDKDDGWAGTLEPQAVVKHTMTFSNSSGVQIEIGYAPQPTRLRRIAEDWLIKVGLTVPFASPPWKIIEFEPVCATAPNIVIRIPHD